MAWEAVNCAHTVSLPVSWGGGAEPGEGKVVTKQGWHPQNLLKNQNVPIGDPYSITFV